MGAYETDGNKHRKQNGAHLLWKRDNAHNQVKQLGKHGTHRDGNARLGRRQRHRRQVRADGGPSAARHKQACAQHQKGWDAQDQTHEHANDAEGPDAQHAHKETFAAQKRRTGKRDETERNGDKRAARDRNVARVGKHIVKQGKQRTVHELHGEARQAHRTADKPEPTAGKRLPAELAYVLCRLCHRPAPFARKPLRHLRFYTRKGQPPAHGRRLPPQTLKLPSNPTSRSITAP